MGTFLPFGLNIIVVAVSILILIFSVFAAITAIKARRSDRIYYLRNKAKELNLPIIKVVDLSGYSVSVLGIVDEKVNDIYFDDKRLSLRVRPSFLDVAEPMIDDGVKTYIYFGQWYYPTGVVGLTCLIDVIDIIRKEITELAFITDGLAIILATTVYEGDVLKNNLKSLLKDYEQEEFLLDDDGNLIQETTIEERPLIGVDGEELTVDDTGDVLMEEYDALLFDAKGFPVYKKNPNVIDETNLLELFKRAKNIVYSNNIRGGFLPIRRAAALIPGKADGHLLNTLITIREKKRDLQNANKDKIGMYLVYMAAIIGFVVIVGYFIYSIMGK